MAGVKGKGEGALLHGVAERRKYRGVNFPAASRPSGRISMSKAPGDESSKICWSSCSWGREEGREEESL